MRMWNKNLLVFSHTLEIQEKKMGEQWFVFICHIWLIVACWNESNWHQAESKMRNKTKKNHLDEFLEGIFSPYFFCIGCNNRKNMMQICISKFIRMTYFARKIPWYHDSILNWWTSTQKTHISSVKMNRIGFRWVANNTNRFAQSSIFQKSFNSNNKTTDIKTINGNRNG